MHTFQSNWKPKEQQIDTAVCYDESIPKEFASELLELLGNETQSLLPPHKVKHVDIHPCDGGSNSECSDPTCIKSVPSYTPVSLENPGCASPPPLSESDIPQFMWCPKYQIQDQADTRPLDLLGIQVSTDYVTGKPLGEKLSHLVIHHQLPKQRSYSRTMPPKDALKFLLESCQSCIQNRDIVATVQ